jgi:lipopolysaccharide/colanic/teichoic acid biosynthesis glycosyltransferase
MTVIPNPHDAATSLRDRRAWSDAEPDARPTSLGRVHVIPVVLSDAVSAGMSEAVYRAVEIVLALIGLIVAMPLMLIAAIAIRLESPGPALFLHRRAARSICLRGRELEGRADLKPPPGGYEPDAQYYVPSYFTLVKLRGMYCDARTRFPEYYAHKYSPENFHSQCFKVQNDPRVTRVGRILRKLSVDELPNLWSVVVGDMRLVGPRPEAPEVLQYYTPEEMIKFTCKPGITGLAQIGGRGWLNWGETLALDLQYVRTRSVALDLKIILLTIMHVLTGHGAF